MFFGALASGADLTGGFHAFEQGPSKQVGVLYRDVRIEFLRRIDEDIVMVCEDGLKVTDAIEKAAAATDERFNIPVSVSGYCYTFSRTDPVLRASMTLSLKSLKKNVPRK